ncbi:creatininase family protein [Alicyclobacillus suci]|uniref:creatininase family protein n=1 Tax=Alicyclobacillus suci TaxID=2816080 RepID=UPI001A8EA7B9|nr:creatininase family protein [Alicyclobacillus suci]
MNSVWLADHTWQEVEEYITSKHSIIVPVGATEQHGPAGPLGVDTYVAMGLAEDAAKATGLLVAPPVWLGDSFHHSAYPGTIWLKSSTMIAVITDIAHSLAEAGFTRQIYVNGHKGSNLPSLTLALREVHEYQHPEALFAIADPLHLGRAVAGEIKQAAEHHGGALELSQVMYRYPNKVREDKLTDSSVDLEAIGGGYIASDLFGQGSIVEISWNSREERAFSPSGSISSSHTASVDLGKRFHEAMVGELCRFIRWFESYTGPLGVVSEDEV